MFEQKPLLHFFSNGYLKRVKENTTIAHREGRGHKMLHTLTRPAHEKHVNY